MENSSKRRSVEKSTMNSLFEADDDSRGPETGVFLLSAFWSVRHMYVRLSDMGLRTWRTWHVQDRHLCVQYDSSFSITAPNAPLVARIGTDAFHACGRHLPGAGCQQNWPPILPETLGSGKPRVEREGCRACLPLQYRGCYRALAILP